MTFQSVCGVTVAALTLGLVTVGPAHAQYRDGNILPNDIRGDVTTVGCLVMGETIRGGQKGKYLLAHPQSPVASVTDGSCTADPNADALTLDDPDKGGLSELFLGRWVEVSGSLEKHTSRSGEHLRELDVKSARPVPVIPAAPAAAVRRPSPSQPQASIPSPSLQASAEPITPTYVPDPPQLPKTASSRPAVALAGLLAVAGGLLLRSYRRRQRGEAGSLAK